MLFQGIGSMESQNGQRLLHVVGIDEAVTREVLAGAFGVFGEIRSVEIPIDNQSGKPRGFAFVEFLEADDARDAVDNMDESELYGRTLRVKFSSKRPAQQLRDPKKAVWADEIYYKKVVAPSMAVDEETQ